MLFFEPSFAFVALVSSTPNPVAAVLALQTALICFPMFWVLTFGNRSPVSTILRIAVFLIILGSATVLLARHERAQYEREYAMKGAADNAVVTSLEAINKSLVLYRTKYGEYPGDLQALGGDQGPFDSQHAGLLKRPLAMEEFFSFGYVADRVAQGKRVGYEIYVDPKQGKWSDLYHYYTDESGAIRFDSTREAAKHGLVVQQQLRPTVTVE